MMEKEKWYSVKEIHPRWVKKSEVESNEYEIDESLCPCADPDEDDHVSEPFSCICGSISLSCQELIQNYPPDYKDKTKKEFYNRALSLHKNQIGKINITRCIYNFGENNSLPIELNEIQIRNEKGFFDYSVNQMKKTHSNWYMNFADNQLFGYYASSLFAQDEIQTLEMPLLASIREYLVKNYRYDLAPYTTMKIGPRGNEEDCASPFLIENVPQWISVNTYPSLNDGTIGNIYGNNFSSATEKELESGIKVLDTAVPVNIIAISALSKQGGKYRRAEIEYTLRAVLCAFEKARFLSIAYNSLSEELKVAIHTGNWGCGAFGGNKEFMYLVQMIGASCAGIDELVFHAVDEGILSKAEEKFRILKEISFKSCIDYLLAQDYAWGIGDGN